MNLSRVFIRRIMYAGIAVIIVGMYPLLHFANGDSLVIVAALAGFSVSAANVVAGYFTIVYGLGKPARLFATVVLASMVVRMFAILALVLVFVSVLGLPVFSLVVSLFTGYIVFMVVEIQLLVKSAGNKSPV